MTKIDFYLLRAASEPSQGDHFACLLTDKAFRGGNRVLISVGSEKHAKDIDQLLWKVPNTGFIPHGQASDVSNKVAIDYNLGPGDHDDCLINLSHKVPDYCARFKRICEVVVFNNEARAASRERFKYYQQRGFPINTHEITRNYA